MASKKHCGKARKGSQLHLQKLVRDHQDWLNCLILSSSPSLREFIKGEPEWVSPLEKEDYCEYCDKKFLEQLDLEEHWEELRKFWPKNGPVWDALAKIKGKNGAKGAILLEAKSHPGELQSTCGASERSSQKIKRSLGAVKSFLGVNHEAKWTEGYYQYANRLAHLYFMNIVCRVPAWLVFLYFTGDKEMKGPETAPGWKAALGKLKDDLGLPHEHPLTDCAITAFAPATDYVVAE